VLVFLLPPSADVLLGRLRDRKTEDASSLMVRLRSARDELRAVHEYGYVVVNDDLEHAYRQVSAIIDAETVRHARVPLLHDRVAALIGELDREIESSSTGVR